MAGNIVYKDIAPGAAEDSSFAATGASAYSDLDLTATGAGEPLITLEPNRWVLNGRYRARGAAETVHLWSAAMSDAAGEFSTPPVLTVTFGSNYTSLGITLIFDQATGEHATDVNVKWYQGSTLKADVDFTPDSAEYFCEQTVTAFNKLVITFRKTSLPERRLRLDQIMIGLVRYFNADEIESANAINEMDLLSAELPASQMDWTLHSKRAVDYMFQLKQPLELRDGGSVIGVYYITQSARITASRYQITAQDAIGVLGEQVYAGSAHLSGISAKTLFTNIVGGAFPIVFDAVADATLRGVLVRQTKREALQQVLFAWGACVRTDGDGTLRVFVPPTTPTEIPKSKTYADGLSVQTAPIVTQVNVVAHTYATNTNGDILINGTRYRDTQTVYTVTNPDVSANDVENIVDVQNATLVSTYNGQAVAQRVFDHSLRRNTHVSKVIYSGEKLGDCLKQPTPWNTEITGNATSISITLSGIVAADITSLEVPPT